MKIVADDKIPFLRGVLERFADVVYIPGSRISKDDLLDADALLIRTRTRCNSALLQGTSVRFIGTATIGFDHIDIAYCDNNKITWTNAPGCNSASVKQYITSALLNLAYNNHFVLKDKTIGIIGVGNVGSKVEKVAMALGMKVLLNDPPREKTEGRSAFVELNSLLHESDIITLHVPLNMSGSDKTYHLFDESNINKTTSRGVWLINTSRGEVVDTIALKHALKTHKVAGAILDVWENEPDIDRELLSSSYLATPHIAGYSTDGKANGTAMIVNSLCRNFRLPLFNWYPVNVPPPEIPYISINCSGKNDEDIIREAVLHTYDIQEDDTKLRISASEFEKQRGDYRLRREFQAYTVSLIGGSEKVINMLTDIGFRVEAMKPLP